MENDVLYLKIKNVQAVSTLQVTILVWTRKYVHGIKIHAETFSKDFNYILRCSEMTNPDLCAT